MHNIIHQIAHLNMFETAILLDFAGRGVVKIKEDDRICEVEVTLKGTNVTVMFDDGFQEYHGSGELKQNYYGRWELALDFVEAHKRIYDFELLLHRLEGENSRIDLLPKWQQHRYLKSGRKDTRGLRKLETREGFAVVYQHQGKPCKLVQIKGIRHANV